MSQADDKIEIENINAPARTVRVDRAKFEAMRMALLAILPEGAPGATVVVQRPGHRDPASGPSPSRAILPTRPSIPQPTRPAASTCQKVRALGYSLIMPS